MTEQEQAVVEATIAYAELRRRRPDGDDEDNWRRYGRDLRLADLRLLAAVEQLQAVQGVPQSGGQGQ